MAQNTWLNSDGLLVKFGTSEGVSEERAGEYKTYGPLREVEVEIEMTELPDADPFILNDVVVIPKNAQIEEIETVVEVACTGATATLDFGLVRLDRTTELDYDGLLANAVLTTLDAVGEKTVYRVGTATAGALVGTILANAGRLTASWDTAAFTAGRVVLRVRYRPEALATN